MPLRRPYIMQCTEIELNILDHAKQSSLSFLAEGLAIGTEYSLRSHPDVRLSLANYLPGGRCATLGHSRVAVRTRFYRRHWCQM